MSTTARSATGPQRRIALSARLRPRDPGSNFAFLWRMPAGLDPARLAEAARRAFGAQRGLHERFEFTSRGGIVAVSVHTPVDCPVRHYDRLSDLQVHVATLGDTTRGTADWPLFDIEVARIGSEVYFVFTGSHLVADATMLYHLLADLDARYADLDAAPDCTLSPSQADPGDDQFDTARTYFTDLLTGIETLTISDWGRRDRDGRIPGRHVRHRPHPSGYDAAKGLAVQLGVRRYSVLLTVFGLLVTALAGAPRVVVSNPVSGRHGGGTAARIRGLLTNALPVLIDTDRHRAFGALCRQVDEQVTALIAVETSAFADVARGLLAANDVEATLPSASFTVYPQPLTPSIDGRRAVAVEVARRYLQYPLTVNVEVSDGRATLLVECADEVPAGDVNGSYWHLLHHAVQNPDARLEEFSWCPDMLQASYLPAVRFGRTSTVVERFSAVAAAHPYATAIESTGATIDYRDLEHAADVIAAQLASHPASMIGVSMDPGIDLVTVVLGVLKAGRAYVPIRPDTPRDRVEAIVQACDGLPIVGTFREDWQDIPGATALHVQLRTPGYTRTPLHPVAPPRPTDTAYVLFTSGTTGRPKGVQISHASVTGMLDAVTADMSLAGKRWSWYHSFAFDASVWEMFGALLFGGVLCIPSPQS
ncbi:MAG: AMP-binding protein, partial [Mycobacterium sp.]